MTLRFTDAYPPRPPFPPERPSPPERPFPPEWPAPPAPQRPGGPGQPVPSPAVQPTHIWLDPGAGAGSVYERLLERRIVMAGGCLDGEAATRLAAQLLTLDAEDDGPIRLELQGLEAELPAALTVMGVLDVLRVPVHARSGGRTSGPALGVLASATRREAYPNAVFALAEPSVAFDGTVSAVAAREEHTRVMVDELYVRLAEVTGREVDEIRADARRERLLTADEAIAYGLIHGLIHGRAGAR